MINKHGITVIDLFCGAGGFSEGFKQAGYDVVYGIDNWGPACDTHYINGLGKTEKLDILNLSINDILTIKKSLEQNYGEIDIVIGSPPCTEFSFAKNGGKGNIEKGMMLVRKFLLFVSLFKPKYWLMENVPRLESVLDKECEGSRIIGWTISFEKLGIPKNEQNELGLKGDTLEIPYGNVFTSSDFGSCQKRKRFIAGNFPIDLMDIFKVKNKDISLGNVINLLSKNIGISKETGFIEDPNYQGHFIPRNHLRDFFYDTRVHPMHWENARHQKLRSIQYGKMRLPEDMNSPSRTVMATYYQSSRETLLFETKEKMYYHGKERAIYRQPTVREIACIQGFPLDFQLASPYIKNRYRLIGNAVPCQLSYSIAKSILYDIEQNINIYKKEFISKAILTRKKIEAHDDKPLIYKNIDVLDEAIDLSNEQNYNNRFKCDANRHLRRKIPSSKLDADSSMAIWENTYCNNNQKSGGNEWKVCIQKGIGKKYYKIYLDEISLTNILFSLSNRFDTTIIKSLLSNLLCEVENGIPLLNNNWNEFPGWNECDKFNSSKFIIKRLDLPGVMTFQDLFIKDQPDIGEIISPLDIFDGIDLLLLSCFKNSELCHLWNETVFINELRDNNLYLHCENQHIIRQMKKAWIPLVTLLSGLISIHILKIMYEKDDCLGKGGYSTSLKIADRKMVNWCYNIKRGNIQNKFKCQSQ